MSDPADHGLRARLEPALIGRYTIQRELGRGGMAVVFLADDLRHQRSVALKVLNPEIAAEWGEARFLREIQLAARLHHPNILPLHDSGVANGLLYYVMPYVEGESLRQRLDRERQLSVGQAVNFTRSLAGALSHAHQRGIIHRDIKPENILIQDEQPLLADFGIALAPEPAGATAGRLTGTGISLGTFAYMSPEQAGGERDLDARSDIYSLAAVAYEMLVGQPPHTGVSARALVSRILADEPGSIRTVRSEVPRGVERAIMRALSKTPADRYPDAATFAAALDDVASSGVRRVFPRKAATIIVATLTVLIIAALTIRNGSDGDGVQLVRRQLTYSGTALLGALSPDGQFLAFVQQHVDSQNVLVRDVAGGAATSIATVSGGYPGILTLEWSPDGASVLIGVRDGARVIPWLGGNVRNLRVPGGRETWAYWLPDGQRVSLHGVRAPLTIFDLESGDTTLLEIRGGPRFRTHGGWSPDGRMFAVATWPLDSLRWTIATTTLDGRTQVLVEDTLPLGSPRWGEHGELYFARGANLIQRIRVSTRSGRAMGEPETAVSDVELWQPQYGHPTFSLSPAGDRIIFSRGVTYANLWMLDRRAADGPDRVPLTAGTMLRRSPSVSPDGEWLAFVQSTGGEGDLFRMRLAGGDEEQLTFGGRVMPNAQVAWSPEGDRLAFQTAAGGVGRVAVLDLAVRRIRTYSDTHASFVTGHLAWAPGARIVYQAPRHDRLFLLDPVTGRKELLTADTTGFLYSPQYSPDGQSLAAGWWRQGPFEARAWLFDLRDGTTRELGRPPWPRGFSPDGRYLYSQEALLPGIWRIDLRAPHRSERLLSPPFRDAECTPAGRLHPDAFICAGFESVADVWMIEGQGQ